MGLVDLQTDLTSLRYGKDTVGGGWSGQPYVTKNPPNDLEDISKSMFSQYPNNKKWVFFGEMGCI